MSEDTIEQLLARALGVDPADVAGVLGEAIRTAHTAADTVSWGRLFLARLEVMRAQGGPLKAVGPDDADVDRRLDAIESGKADPGPRFTPPPAGDD